VGGAKQHIVDLLRPHATAPGSGTAIEHGQRSVTYREMVELVDDRAAELRRRGAGGALIAIERRKSLEFVVDFLAVYAVGGTAIPLDPDLPADRRATFAALTRPRFVLRDASVVPIEGGRDPGASEVPADAAFIYFTSGSTGIPKPVLGSASAQWTFLRWFCPEFGVGAGDRFAFMSGLSFEASLRDIFPPLAGGATLVIPEDADSESPETTVGWLAEQRITVLTAVPSVARSWLRHGRTPCPDVRAVFFVGEPLATDVLDAWPTVFPRTGIRVNSYGSTEGGQATIVRRVAAGERFADRVPAGRPVPGTRFCLIDPAARLDAALVRSALATPDPAATGEIVVVSRSCSHGYLGLPGEQSARFADLGDGVTAYRTGDLGRVDAEGELVVIGRADDEVKINGVRVHPAEVTRAVRAQRGVADAFVVATEGGLTAFVVPAEGGPLAVPELRRALLDVLPLAMIPARFVETDALPTLRTGKVDRTELVRRASLDAAREAYVAPANDVEEWLADAFGELLEVDRPSATDDFFALGGDSIAATRLSARITRDFGVALTQRDVFAAATLTGIGEAILEQQLLAADPAELAVLLDALDEAGLGAVG